MNRDALWRILGLRRVPPKLIYLMSELYSDTESAVRRGDTISDLFTVVTGVHQGCALAPILFSDCMDWILGRMSDRSSCGASFGNANISTLISQTMQSSVALSVSVQDDESPCRVRT